MKVTLLKLIKNHDLKDKSLWRHYRIAKRRKSKIDDNTKNDQNLICLILLNFLFFYPIKK